MRIPNTDRLRKQTLTEAEAEFVWKFGNQQFIFRIEKDKKIYMEAGEVNEDGKYLNNIHWCEFPIDLAALESEQIWQKPKMFKYQNFFHTGSTLIPLTVDVLEYLN